MTKPYNRPCGRRKTGPPPCGCGKCTPFAAFGGVSPGGGDSSGTMPCYAYEFRNGAESRLPPPGEVVRSTNRGAFPRAKRGCLVFAADRQRCRQRRHYKLIARKGNPQPSEPCEPSEPSEPCEPSEPYPHQ